MHKRMKKLLGIALAVSMVGALAVTASASDGDTIKIGYYGPLSGDTASIGTAGYNGAKLAIDQWNENGGVLGEEIEFIYYDDEGNTETSVKDVSRLLDQDHVVGIVGSHLSSSVLATSDLNEEEHVVQIATGTSDIWTNIGLEYTYRATVCASLFNQDCYNAMVELGATRIATLSAETEYAQTATATIDALIEENPDMEIVDEEGYTTGDTDYSGQVTKMLAADPDGVLLNGGPEDLGKVIKALRMQGYDGLIYGIETLVDPVVLDMAGDYADGIISCCCYFIPASIDEATSEAERSFLEAYDEEFGGLPDSEVAYRAYDAANILLEAIEIAGTTDGDAVRDAILTNTFDGIAGTFDFSDGSGDGILEGTAYYVDNGQIITLEEYLAEN